MNENESAQSPTVLLQRVHHWRMAFFGLVILFAGMVIGGAAALVAVGREDGRSRARGWFPGPDPNRVVEQISEDLNLSPEQRGKLKPIVEKRMKALRQIQDKARPQIEEQVRLMNQDISALLTEQQRHRWDEQMQQLQRGFRRDGRGPGPGGRRGPGPGPGGPPFGDRGERPDGRPWRQFRESGPPEPNRPEGPPPMPPIEIGPEQPPLDQDANEVRE